MNICLGIFVISIVVSTVSTPPGDNDQNRFPGAYFAYSMQSMRNTMSMQSMAQSNALITINNKTVL